MNHEPGIKNQDKLVLVFRLDEGNMSLLFAPYSLFLNPNLKLWQKSFLWTS